MNFCKSVSNVNQKEQTALFSSTFAKLTGLTLIVGFVVRIVLLLNEQTQVDFSVLEWSKIFLLGTVNDLCVAIIGCFLMWLNLIFLSDSKYKQPWGYIIWGFIILCFCYVTFFNTIFDDYGSAAPRVARYFFLYKLISFGVRLFVPSVRRYWSFTIYLVVFFLYVLCILLFSAVGEYLFWDEFGVRYNFIAVDYLVYTHEVIGNIMESYPVLPLFTVLIVVSAAITYFLTRNTKPSFNNYPLFKNKVLVTASFTVLALVASVLLGFNARFQNEGNVYVNELQANGTYKFYNAFVNSKLEYKDFYQTLPQDEAVSILNRTYYSKGADNLQLIRDSLPEVRKNIVLITVESLSASFLKYYGNKDNVTPNLDKLVDESLVFNNFYATGNRTVRGLEAVTLCLPPSAGESIIKQPDNKNLFSTGKVLKDKGYTVQYLYGGDSYFDNMGTFFSGNGYDIVDKKNFSKDEISFSNIWGVCDEDMFNKALKVFDENSQSGKPFFGHIMTVSNHRPFTYPEGKIDIPGNSKSRNGGIKYTDYAIGKFIEDARQQPWFDNTVFVIVADHCASSAGKTEIPLDKYHIPALIYAPGFVQPRQEDMLVSQIDLMPTVFGMLNFSYDSQFYGKDVFSPNYISRAFVATYQSLGYWENNVLTILSPVRKKEQYEVQRREPFQFELSAMSTTDTILSNRAIANYQTASLVSKYY